MAGRGVRARVPIENLTGEAPVATRVVFQLALVFSFATLLALAGIASGQTPANPQSQNESKAEQSPDQAKDQGNFLVLSAQANGNFTVTNPRNKFSKKYTK